MENLFLKGLKTHWDEIDCHSYLRSIPSLSSLEEMVFHKPITYFVGENGSGKSTLLEAMAIASGFNPEGGTKNYSFSTHDSHSELCDHLTLIKGPFQMKWGYFLRAESFYNVATKEEEYSREKGGVPQKYHERSHGESFLKLLTNNFTSKGLYFLDEPEAALSPQRQLSFLSLLHESIQNGSQFFIVSHSPILLGYPEAEILSFDETVHSIPYEETDSYQIMKMFLNHKEQVLNTLFEEE